MDKAKPGMVNILTRNASGHLTLKSMMAASLFPFFTNAAITASLVPVPGTRRAVR